MLNKIKIIHTDEEHCQELYQSIIKSLSTEMYTTNSSEKINKILEVMKMRVNKKKTILVHN